MTLQSLMFALQCPFVRNEAECDYTAQEMFGVAALRGLGSSPCIYFPYSSRVGTTGQLQAGGPGLP